MVEKRGARATRGVEGKREAKVGSLELGMRASKVRGDEWVNRLTAGRDMAVRIQGEQTIAKSRRRREEEERNKVRRSKNVELGKGRKGEVSSS